MNDHPEITELLKQRWARRRRLAQLSFEEKIEIVERLRELQINRGLMEIRRKKLEALEKAEKEGRPAS